jgi:hypothetical protein
MFLCRGELPEVSKLLLKNIFVTIFYNVCIHWGYPNFFFKIRLLKELTFLLFNKQLPKIKDDFLKIQPLTFKKRGMNKF